MFSIWLIPSQNDLIQLSQVINHNQFILNRPAYIPHMTMIQGDDKTMNWHDTLNQIACSTPRITLNIQDKGMSYHTFYRSFFLTFHESSHLNCLHEKFKPIGHDQYHFIPHLSLAYGADAKQQESLEIPEAMHSVTFDKIALVSDHPNEDNNAIASWRIQYMVDLNKPSLDR